MRYLVVILFFLPTPLLAQARTVVSGYLAGDATIADQPLLLGLTAAREAGFLGGRVSVGFDMTDPAVNPTPELPGDALAPEPKTTGIWSSDADLLLYAGDGAGTGTLIPYAVAGFGLRGYQTDDRLGAAANYSYGGGFRAPLGGGFAMEGEVRRREVISPGSETRIPATRSGMEYRFGLSVGFGSRPSLRVPNTLPVPAVRPGGYAASTSRVVSATLSSAERYIGVPYLWGGNTPQEGFDCSGFIRYVYLQNGITLPRVSRDQARHGESVPLDLRYFQPGDILAFASDGRTVDHSAIYAGNGRIIHSSSSGRGVRYDDLYSSRGKWYRDHLVAARRVAGTSSLANRD